MNLKETALKYLKNGKSVFPIGKDKRPLIAWEEYQSHLATVEDVEKWWSIYPEANIGLVTGKISNITVVDFDLGSANYQSFPETLTVRTGSGGYHLYYQYYPIRNRTGILPHIDIRGDGGYVVAYPSETSNDFREGKLYKKGGKYELVKEMNFARFPHERFSDIETPTERKHLPDLVNIPIGSRNASMASLVGKLILTAKPDDWDKEIYPVVCAINQTYDPPLPDAELKNVYRSVCSIEKKRKFGSKFVQGASSMVLSRLSDIQPVPISWLWSDRIALGKLTLIAGDPGLGKSLLTAAMSAIVSKGYPWPVDGTLSPVGDVILLSAEDDPADTIRPRLDAAEADCERIHIIKAVKDAEVNAEGIQVQRMFSLRRDIPVLDKLLPTLPNCRLIIIDPISAYLDGTDSHNNSDVRGLLAPLAEMAARYKVAFVLVHHLNKGNGNNAMYRTMGSLAFTAAVRSAYIVTMDKNNPKRRLMLPLKNNIAKDNTGLAYSVIEASNGSPVMAWEAEPVLTTANEALAVPEQEDKERSGTDEAVDFLSNLLSKGPVKVSDVKREARDAGINEKPLRLARERLGLKSVKSDFKGGWVWNLSQDALSAQDASSKKEGTLGSVGHLRSRRAVDDMSPNEWFESLPEKPPSLKPTLPPIPIHINAKERQTEETMEKLNSWKDLTIKE